MPAVLNKNSIPSKKLNECMWNQCGMCHRCCNQDVWKMGTLLPHKTSKTHLKTLRKTSPNPKVKAKYITPKTYRKEIYLPNRKVTIMRPILLSKKEEVQNEEGGKNQNDMCERIKTEMSRWNETNRGKIFGPTVVSQEDPGEWFDNTARCKVTEIRSTLKENRKKLIKSWRKARCADGFCEPRINKFNCFVHDSFKS